MNRPAASALFLAVTAAMLCAADAPPAAGVPVTYSSRDVDRTPKGNLPFHGPFERETLHVTADNLPDHAFLEISFDLLILRSWEGAMPIVSTDQKPSRVGPDYLRIGIRGGPTLLYNSFSTIPARLGATDNSARQGYPSPVPGEEFDAGTGALSKNTLGYHLADPGRGELIPMDAVYRMRFVVPHHGASVALAFSGLNLQDVTHQSWGVTDVKIVPLAAGDVKKPSAADLEAAMKSCLSNRLDQDLPTQFQTLINGMDDTVAFFEKTVTSQTVDEAMVVKTLGELAVGDDQIKPREAAYQALVNLGPAAEVAIRDARRPAVGDHRLRLDWALMNIATRRPDDDMRPALLATRVLEIIGTPKALELRRKLVMK